MEVQEEDEDGQQNADGTTQFGEPYIYNFIQNLLLILGFTVIGRRRLMQLLQHPDIGRLLRLAGHDDIQFDSDEEDNGPDLRWRAPRARPDPDRFPKVPSEQGTELMNSGTFGSNEAHTVTSSDRSTIGKKKRLALRILDRELAIDSPAKRKLNQRLMAQVS